MNCSGLLVAGYWLLVAGCGLLVTGCWLLVTGYWESVHGVVELLESSNNKQKKDRCRFALSFGKIETPKAYHDSTLEVHFLVRLW